MNNDAKKIMFVIPSLGSGGAERVVCTLANEMSQRDYEVGITLTANDRIYYTLSDRVQRIMLYNEKLYGRSNVLTRYYNRVKGIRKSIVDFAPDVVISFQSETNVEVCLAVLGLKVPVIVSERNDPAIDPASRAKQLLRKLAYCRADGFVFQTPDAQAYFNHRIQKRSCIILNPLTAQLPAPHEGTRDKRIVAVGRLNRQKNYPLLIRAFSEFVKTEQEYTLEIYGEGLLEDEIRSDLAEKGLQDKVVLKGFCRNVHEQIRSAAFFVMTSDFEGMPNALVEAMALGLPCISTDCPCGGPRMLIQDGENGLLVPVQDAEALLQAMCKMAQMPALAAQMGKKAELVKERVRLDAVTEQWIAYIQKIC